MTPVPASPRLLALGDAAWTVEFGRVIDVALVERVARLAAQVRAAQLAGVVDLVPTLRSLTVHFDPDQTDADALGERLLALAAVDDAADATGRHWRLPVCVEPPFAPDLAELAVRVGLTPDAVVAQLTGAVLRVGLIGFMPGFPYLIGVPAALTVPRRATPRTRVPAGSVALAAGMCGVYPWDSPGGWWLVGHLPLPLFDAGQPDAPAWLAAGDTVRWQTVEAAHHAALAADWARGALTRADFLVADGSGR
jgi:KipI family sensor histidine kinase inhibitor